MSTQTAASPADRKLARLAASASVAQLPARRSWFYCAPGEWPTAAWIVSIHVLAAVGIVLLPIPAWPLLVLAVVLYALGGLGTTLVYHRSLAHRSLELHPAIERALLFFAMFNGSGDPISWVANHRYHHAHSDTPLDISSPRNGGFWHAHLRWLWQAPPADAQRYCPDLLRRGLGRWRRRQVPILALSLFGGLALAPFFGWQIALAAACWLGAVRLVGALHVQCSVNSICHLGTRDEHGSAKNVAWLTLFHLGQGENWHANHHRAPGAARLGFGWRQLDLGWWTLVLLERWNLATSRRSRLAGRKR